jgi:hypothetical protein
MRLLAAPAPQHCNNEYWFRNLLYRYVFTGAVVYKAHLGNLLCKNFFKEISHKVGRLKMQLVLRGRRAEENYYLKKVKILPTLSVAY